MERPRYAAFILAVVQALGAWWAYSRGSWAMFGFLMAVMGSNITIAVWNDSVKKRSGWWAFL